MYSIENVTDATSVKGNKGSVTSISEALFPIENEEQPKRILFEG